MGALTPGVGAERALHAVVTRVPTADSLKQTLQARQQEAEEL